MWIKAIRGFRLEGGATVSPGEVVDVPDVVAVRAVTANKAEPAEQPQPKPKRGRPRKTEA